MWCYIPNIKAIYFVVSDKIFFMFPSKSLCKACDPLVEAIFSPMGIN